MKKLLNILALIILSHTTFAQANKGKWSIGAGMNYSHQNSTEEQSINPNHNESVSTYSYYDARFGYFLSDNFIIGLTGYYSGNNSHSSNETSSSTNDNHSTNFGIYCRFYHMFKESKFGFFGELDATYTTGARKSESYYSTTLTQVSNGDITGYNLSLLPGIIYFVHPKIALETRIAFIAYNNSTTDYVMSYVPATQPEWTSTQKSNSVAASLSINSISIGVSYYFGTGKK